jgi:excisionase family DNA binding protein
MEPRTPEGSASQVNDGPSGVGVAVPDAARDDLLSKLFVTADELAAILRLDRKTLYAMAAANKIPGCRRCGKQYRFHLPTVLAWFEAGPDRDRRRGGK